MKTRERKQTDLNALTEQLNNSKSAMIISFNKLTVNKDQEFRNQLRGAGASFQVVKNTLARLAVKGTAYEEASEHFKGVTGIAWSNADAVILSKTVSKFVKDNADIYSFKAGIVEGKVVNLKQVEAIASLPSKEELISKLMFVINAQAQRIVTVINAVPRNLAVVVKLIGELPAEQKGATKVQETTREETAQVSEPIAATEEQNTAAQTTEQVSETTDETVQAVEQSSEPVAETVENQDTEQTTEQSAEPDASQEANETTPVVE
jgi:large subunit ribosomal protein L10